jgi:hypothetical protein
MTMLRNRIAGLGSNMAGASACLAGVTGATPMEMPMSMITYHPVQGYPGGTGHPWPATLAYEDLYPLWTADGGVIPAQDNVGWGWVHAAGRP